MATIYVTARVREDHLLEIAETAVQTLNLIPGEEISVAIERIEREETPAFPPNEVGLTVMREITQRQQSRPFTDGSTSLKLLHEARAGAMYGYEPTE